MTERERAQLMFDNIMRGVELMGDDIGYIILSTHLANAARENIAICKAAQANKEASMN